MYTVRSASRNHICTYLYAYSDVCFTHIYTIHTDKYMYSHTLLHKGGMDAPTYYHYKYGAPDCLFP